MSEPDRSGKARGRPPADLPRGFARALRKRLTPQEAKLWVALRGLRPAGYHFRRQVPILTFVVDFACLKHRVIAEADGSQHGLDDNLAADRLRDEALARLGFVVLRFWNGEIDRNLRGVMDTIVARLQQNDPTRPGFARPPSPAGRENPR
jgi:very-short-patch-repair endonuclease